MGIPSEMRDIFANRKNSLMIASPIEDEKILRTKNCTEEGVRAGAKAAAVACVASAVPTSGRIMQAINFLKVERLSRPDQQ